MARTTFETPLGRCAVSWREQALTGFELPEASPAPDDRPPSSEIATLIARVQRHLAGEPQDFASLAYAFELVPAFNADVLRATLLVKSGQTCTYGEIAARLGYPASTSRAVGAALAGNRWPLLIPCHRIVGADGRMTGFSGPGGVKQKLRLLALEGAQLLAE